MKEYLHLEHTKVPFYSGNLIVVLTNSTNKLKEYLPEFDDREVFAHAWNHAYRNKQGYFLILNFHNKYNKVTNGEIAHEALHICNFIACRCGFIPDFNNDEPLAYLLTWVTNQAHKLIRKHNFKIS